MTIQIQRTLLGKLKEVMFGGKAIIIAGPRQVGKTTLIQQLLAEVSESALNLDGDDPSVRNMLQSPNTEELRSIIGNNKVLVIDEAQRIKDIGITAKIITDKFSDVQLVVCGSSSLELGNKFQESLTGRKWTFEMFPVSWNEWQEYAGYLKASQDLENRMVYGFYPEVLNTPGMATDALYELIDSYLFKDVFALSGLRKPDEIQKLLKALAWQMGNEVVMRELGETCGIDPKTAANYIKILNMAYVVFPIGAFSGNLRNEIKTNRKVYFYDNGIRNAIIGNLQPLANRNDVGQLWENFLMAERMKVNSYARKRSEMHFWRTKQQQEIDYIETIGSTLEAYEFKWKPGRRIKASKTFTEAYNTPVKPVNRDNFRDFVIQY